MADLDKDGIDDEFDSDKDGDGILDQFEFTGVDVNNIIRLPDDFLTTNSDVYIGSKRSSYDIADGLDIDIANPNGGDVLTSMTISGSGALNTTGVTNSGSSGNYPSDDPVGLGVVAQYDHANPTDPNVTVQSYVLRANDSSSAGDPAVANLEFGDPVFGAEIELIHIDNSNNEREVVRVTGYYTDSEGVERSITYSDGPDGMTITTDQNAIVRANGTITSKNGPNNNEVTIGNGTVQFNVPVDRITVETWVDRTSNSGDGLNGIAFKVNIDGVAVDTDGDGIYDHEDKDSDNDGILDITEAIGDPNGTDSDGDGVPDIADQAPNNPNNSTIIPIDTDGDGIADYRDLDSDDDGILDNVEFQDSDNYVAPDGKDSDGDGVDDAYDSDPNDKNVADPNVPVDTDGDGSADYIDTDSDNDGISDTREQFGDDYVPPSGDDADGDGVDDVYDSHPNDPGRADIADRKDTDGDGVPDFRDLDSDNDGILDSIEAIGDTNGPDSDGDGVPDAADEAPNDPNNSTIVPVDTDGDGIADYLDRDSDGDGILDMVEFQESGSYTPPTGMDDDGDGVDNAYDSHPNDANRAVPIIPVDTDGDGIADYLDLDSDNDGITDNIESQSTAGYVAPDGKDSDGDGVDDAYDSAPNNDLIANIIGAPEDTDSDGIADYRDVDSDNDGIVDNVEAQDTANYIAPTGSDADRDGIDDAYDSDKNKRAGSTAINPVNTDKTGDDDYRDLDADGDGISDQGESGLAPDTSGKDSDSDGLLDGYDPDGDDTDGDHSNLGSNVDNNGDLVVPDSDGIGAADFQTPICFTKGAMIAAKGGAIAVEKIKIGDMIETADNGYQAVRWVKGRKFDRDMLETNPHMRPIRIKAGALGANLPERELLVSPQHRMLVEGKIAERMFDQAEVLIPAKQMVMINGVDVADDLDEVTYYHFALSQHEVVFAEGAPSESLYLGKQALTSLPGDSVKELYDIFPILQEIDMDAIEAPKPARRLIPGRCARELVSRHIQNNKIFLQKAS